MTYLPTDQAVHCVIHHHRHCSSQITINKVTENSHLRKLCSNIMYRLGIY